jgi:SAM-dependent methyltransferase
VPLLAERVTWGVQHFGPPIIEFARTRGLRPVALDIGCGRHPFLVLLQSCGFDYLSTDVQQNPERSVDFICPLDGTLDPALLALGPFPFGLCTEVLEHVADWQKAFSNFAMLIEPGGRLVITCPHIYQLHEEPYDFWRPTLHALRAFADRNSFAVIHAEAAGLPAEALGTLMASTCVLPKKRRSPVPWLLARVLNGYRRFGVWLLANRLLRKTVFLAGQTYVSNFVVLERKKPDQGAAT